jgi:hypothetical protein
VPRVDEFLGLIDCFGMAYRPAFLHEPNALGIELSSAAALFALPFFAFAGERISPERGMESSEDHPPWPEIRES